MDAATAAAAAAAAKRRKESMKAKADARREATAQQPVNHRNGTTPVGFKKGARFRLLTDRMVVGSSAVVGSLTAAGQKVTQGHAYKTELLLQLDAGVHGVKDIRVLLNVRNTAKQDKIPRVELQEGDETCIPAAILARPDWSNVSASGGSDELKKVLKGCEVFNSMDNPMITDVAGRFKMEMPTKGTLIFKQGFTSDSDELMKFYCVFRGSCRVFDSGIGTLAYKGTGMYCLPSTVCPQLT